MKLLIQVIILAFSTVFISACGSDREAVKDSEENREIYGTWELDNPSFNDYFVFGPTQRVIFYETPGSHCFVHKPENVSYSSNHTFIIEKTREKTEYAISGDELTLNPLSDYPRVYFRSRTNMNSLSHCDNPDISGKINIELTFADFSDALVTKHDNSDIEIKHEITISIDMDNSLSITAGDLELKLYFDSKSSSIKNPAPSDLSPYLMHFFRVTTDQDGNIRATSSEGVAFPELTVNSTNRSIMLTIARGAFESLNDITDMSAINFAVKTDFYSNGESASDTFPSNGYISLANLPSSDAEADVTYNGAENVNLIDIKTISVAITQ